MTVHSRRYGRWCREHCDDQGRPLPRPGTGEAVEAGPVPVPEDTEPGADPAAETP